MFIGSFILLSRRILSTGGTTGGRTTKILAGHHLPGHCWVPGGLVAFIYSMKNYLRPSVYAYINALVAMVAAYFVVDAELTD